MKNLSNCTPTEFLKQAMAMRAPFKAWLENTGIPEIRKHMPDGYDDMTDEEKVEAATDQARKNVGEMLNAALEKDFDGTIELICMATFTPRKDFDKHPFSEYMTSLLDCLKNDGVKSFFTLYL